MLSQENCKICDKKGLIFFSKEYSDDEFKDYFENFYGNQNFNLINNYIGKNKYELLKCEKCEFIWQKFAPEEKFAYTLYEEIIDKKKSFQKSKLLQEKRKIRYQDEFEFIFNYFQNKKINILDFGAGWGSWLNVIDNTKVDKYAFELSPSRKKYLIEEGIKVLDEISIEKYQSFFDYIRIEQVLEHVVDINLILKLIKKIAKDNCIVHIGVPNGKKEILKNHKIIIKKGAVQPLEHLNCFSNRSLKKALIKYNFEPIKLKKIIFTHLKNNKFNLEKLRFLAKDILDSFFSTSIKFKLK